MTEEIMPKEDRMGKILSFIGGCIAGVLGVFTVAVISESGLGVTPSPSDSLNNSNAKQSQELQSEEKALFEES